MIDRQAGRQAKRQRQSKIDEQRDREKAKKIGKIS